MLPGGEWVGKLNYRRRRVLMDDGRSGVEQERFSQRNALGPVESNIRSNLLHKGRKDAAGFA